MESEKENENKNENIIIEDIEDIEDDEDFYIDNILDTSWIKEFELLDKEYESFYKEDNHFIQLHHIYINKNNEIEKMTQEKLIMKTSNCISREEIIGIIKKNSIFDNKIYSALSILKYNIDIDPMDVKSFLSDTNDDIFLSPIKNIDTIPLNQTISMFQDLNDLMILYYECDKKNKKNKKNGTRKIYIQLNNHHKKTNKKQLKA